MTHPRWQFSIRTLLALTAFLSIALAFVMKLPMLSAVLLMVAVPVLLLVAVLHIANYVTSDARPVLSILARFLLAGFFAIYTIGALLVPFAREDLSFPLITIMGTCCSTCVGRAVRGCLLVRRRSAEHTSVDAIDAKRASEQLPE